MKQTNFLKSLFLLFALIVGSSSVWAETVTYTVASTSSVNVSGTAPTGSSASYSSTYGTACQLTKSNSMTLTLSGYAGYRITNITLSMKSNTSGGSGNLSYSTDNGSTYTDIISTAAFDNSSWHGSWSTSYVDISKDVTIIPTSSALKIKIAATANSLYCQSFKITYEATKTLDHISVTTQPTKTAYKIGEPVDLTDMVVTATYTDKSTENVTSKCTFNPASGATLDSSGDQDIAISYSGKNTTQAITVASVTGLAVKTAPTTVKYRIGDYLDLTGLVLTATYSDEGTKDITDFTASPADGSTLNTSGNVDVTLSYYGQICTQRVTVGNLSSITYNATGVGAFANTTYTEKDTFNPEGLVITAHFDNDLDVEVSGYTLSPTTETELATSDKKITVSYTWNEVNKTVDIPITVNAGAKYTVSFDAGNGAYTGGNITETEYQGGITLPAATIDLDGWVFAGWATASQTSTQNRPTLYLEGDTYYPTANTTLYAVYTLEGIDGTKYQRVTELSEATSASSMIFVDKVNSKVFKYNGSNVTYDTAPTEINGQITPSDGIVWTLDGNNTDGYNVKTTSLETNRYVGFNTPAENTDYANIQTYLSNTLSNGLWKFVQSKKGSDLFTLRNNTEKTSGKVGSLRFYSSGSRWQAYYLAASGFDNNDNTALKLYIPVKTVYNSNPAAAIIQPTVAFEKGNTTLYLDGTTNYTNAATVTGIDKPISYSSSDESVATVNASGVVTAVGIGTATITAKVAAELAVNTVGTDTYDVVVKNTTTVSGLKSIASSSTAVNFAADLTDAVVTYVDATSKYAYIQDASAAIMVYISGGHSLTVGKKINGAISGQVKAPYSIQQISSIDVSKATVNDGVIPAAEEKTLAYIVANAASLDGKKVLVNDATVSTGMNNATSGGVITDDGGTTTINIIAPNNLTLKATEIGNFTGFVSTYVNGLTTTYRLNLYDASQYQKTRNVETAQTLSFANNAIALDEVTSELTDFIGQAVSGAHTTVTYSKVDESSIIGDFNTETGALTLNGACGTATITATAAAGEVVEAGVTTPYLVASESYTITVSPRYMVTFSVNGIETVLRQATSGAAIAVPTPGDLGDYTFMGWSTSTVDPTDDAPSMTDLGATVIPTDNDDKYYAVYAQERAGGEENRTSEFVIKTSSTPSNPIVIDGVSWTYSGVDFANSANACMPENSTVTFALPNDALNAVSVEITSTSNIWAGSTKLSLPLTDKDDNVLTTLYKDNYSYDFTSTDNNVGPYTITSTTTDSKKAYIDHITVTYAIIGTENYDYRTSLPNVEVTISESKFLSFCYGSKLDFSESDVKAYKASVDGVGKVTLTKVDVVPAGEGVVLYCETPDTYSIPVTTKDASDVTGNEMVGVLVRTQVVWNPTTGIYNYILQQGQFNKANDGYLKANRAYLSTNYDVTPLGAKVLSVVFAEDETDGIRSIENSRIENSDYYNLAGQKVGADYKGIVIVNGKKYMRK